MVFGCMVASFYEALLIIEFFGQGGKHLLVKCVWNTMTSHFEVMWSQKTRHVSWSQVNHYVRKFNHNCNVSTIMSHNSFPPNVIWVRYNRLVLHCHAFTAFMFQTNIYFMRHHTTVSNIVIFSTLFTHHIGSHIIAEFCGSVTEMKYTKVSVSHENGMSLVLLCGVLSPQVCIWRVAFAQIKCFVFFRVS